MMFDDAMVQDAFSGHGFGEGHSLCMRCQKKLYSQRSRAIGLGPKCERILAFQEQLQGESEFGQILLFPAKKEAVWDTTSNSWQA